MKDEKMDSRYKQAKEMYDGLPTHIKEDVVDAGLWARDTLMREEGEGHIINVTANDKRECSCSFAKPEWGGDHSGPYMELASEAIVMAVCTYLNGM